MDDTLNNCNKLYAMIDEEGQIVCMNNSKFYSLPLEKAKLEDIFTFWSLDMKRLKDYINGINTFYNLDSDIDFDKCTLQ